MIKRTLLSMLGFLTIVSTVAVVVPSVYAEDKPTPTPYTTPSTPEDRTDGQSGNKQKAEEQRNDLKQRLQDKRSSACEAHQAQIKSIMNRITDRGQRHVNRFMTIAEKVEAFYVKRGKTLATYDQLVSEVNAKKAAADIAIQAVKTSAESFSCSSNNPRGDVLDFKTKVRAQEEALKQLRTAVKNLIVGVKSVQGTTEREEQ